MLLPLVTCSTFNGQNQSHTEVPANIPPGTTVLYLYNNQISTIQSGAFTGLGNLQILELRGNQISTIQAQAFTGLSSLQAVNLGGNQISTIQSGAFSGLSNLQRLLLSGNQISTLQSGPFTGLSSLHTLNLNHNQFSTIQPGAFTGLDNLQELWLSSNKIATMQSGSFRGLGHLKELHLCHNQIVFMSLLSFDDTPTLHLLSVHNNNLRTLDSRLFINIKRPLLLYLRDNPLDCGTLCWLKQEESAGTILFQHQGMQPECTIGSWDSMDCSQGKFSVFVWICFGLTNTSGTILSELTICFCAGLTCTCSERRTSVIEMVCQSCFPKQLISVLTLWCAFVFQHFRHHTS